MFCKSIIFSWEKKENLHRASEVYSLVQGSKCDVVSGAFYPFCSNSGCVTSLSSTEHSVFAVSPARNLFPPWLRLVRRPSFYTWYWWLFFFFFPTNECASLCAYLQEISSAVLLPSHWVLAGTYAKLALVWMALIRFVLLVKPLPSLFSPDLLQLIWSCVEQQRSLMHISLEIFLCWKKILFPPTLYLFSFNHSFNHAWGL